MSTKKIVCPKCDLADQIQKVSAIVAAGTSRQASVSTSDTVSGTVGGVKVYGSQGDKIGSYRGSSGTYGRTTTTVEGVGRTDLAAALAPPNPPEKPARRHIGWWDRVDKLKILTILVLGLGVGWAVGGIVEYINFRWLVAAIICGTISGIITAYATYQFFKNTIRKEYLFVPKSIKIEEENARMDKAYKAELQAYSEQKERWSKLYYCHRDDHVFEPT